MCMEKIFLNPSEDGKHFSDSDEGVTDNGAEANYWICINIGVTDYGLNCMLLFILARIYASASCP